MSKKQVGLWCVKKVARSEIWLQSSALDFSQLYFGSNRLASKAMGTISVTMGGALR